MRAVIRVDVTRVADSCGYAVPLMRYDGDRDVLDRSNGRKDAEALAAYRVKKNTTSIDGLPGWPGAAAEAPAGGSRPSSAGQAPARRPASDAQGDGLPVRAS